MHVVHKPFFQACMAPSRTGIAHCGLERLLLADDDNKAPPSCHSRVEKVLLQEQKLLHPDRDNDDREFGSLAFMNRDSVGK